jgi:Response regulators consisting of a CheY-like receiver domain and a winged-helix DNA-binding domain
MNLMKNKQHLLYSTCIGVILAIILHGVWLSHAYLQTRQLLMIHIKDAFEEAYRKEQTYRIPVIDIVNPGALTIESCGTEEIQIIRRCPAQDTVVYKNPSGHSIENFINRVFVDLREHIVPMNINCLADLFAGMLYEKGITAYFVVERFDVESRKVLDTSLLPDKRQPKMNPENTILLEISEKESLRAIIEMKASVVYGQMTGTFVITLCLLMIIVFGLIFVAAFLYNVLRDNDIVAFRTKEDEIPARANHESDGIDNAAGLHTIYNIGQYVFDPAKNELYGYGKSVQLNKKENSILYALCANMGNVVWRTALLSENWGDSGAIYSRSLDTYIATLRKYFKKEPSIQIITIKGVGYKIVY